MSAFAEPPGLSASGSVRNSKPPDSAQGFSPRSRSCQESPVVTSTNRVARPSAPPLTRSHVVHANQRSLLSIALAIVVGGSVYTLVAQQPAAPPQPMSFFITSVGMGDGANLKGLAGADAHCQMLATAAGRGTATWRAYLSTQGPGAVNARDRIGKGPWFAHGGERRVAQSVEELHGDTLEQARLGNALGKAISLTEKGERVNGVGDMPNQHDMLTGSSPTGVPTRTAWITPATTGRATARARPSSATPTSRGATTGPGTRPTPARVQPAEPGEHRRRGPVLLLRRELRPAGRRSRRRVRD